MVQLAIMVGGPYDRIPDIKQADSKEIIWIGVDRGSVRLLEQGIIPKIALGDFDSVTEEELKEIKKKLATFESIKLKKMKRTPN